MEAAGGRQSGTLVQGASGEASRASAPVELDRGGAMENHTELGGGPGSAVGPQEMVEGGEAVYPGQLNTGS